MEDWDWGSGTDGVHLHTLRHKASADCYRFANPAEALRGFEASWHRGLPFHGNFKSPGVTRIYRWIIFAKPFDEPGTTPIRWFLFNLKRSIGHLCINDDLWVDLKYVNH